MSLISQCLICLVSGQASTTMSPIFAISGLRIARHFCWLFEFYILATSKIISGWELSCDSAAPLGNQATSTMTSYPIQSHYPDTELISPCPILLMPSARLGSDKYQFYESLVWLDQETSSWSPTHKGGVLLIQPPHPVRRQQRNICKTGTVPTPFCRRGDRSDGWCRSITCCWAWTTLFSWVDQIIVTDAITQ